MAENKYGVSDPAITVDPITARHPFGIFNILIKTTLNTFIFSKNNNFNLTCVVTDVPSAPGMPKGIDTTEESITITWTKPRNDGGSPITGYMVEKRLISDEKWTKASHAIILDTTLK